MDQAIELEPELEASSDLGFVISDADVVVVLNSESAYEEIDWSALPPRDIDLYVLDTRGILDRNSLQVVGIKYDVLGT